MQCQKHRNKCYKTGKFLCGFCPKSSILSDS
jgi:hypothetical protein